MTQTADYLIIGGAFTAAVAYQLALQGAKNGASNAMKSAGCHFQILCHRPNPLLGGS